jgi:UDP-N-acetylenolpyruvoylglucosamine reductase
LICLARQSVARRFDVMLELEVVLWGQFPEMDNFEIEAKFNE